MNIVEEMHVFYFINVKNVFIAVLPKQTYPTVGYAENDVLLPQWAIAVIVIGLASLLFVIIFGVTVVSMEKMIKLSETENVFS